MRDLKLNSQHDLVYDKEDLAVEKTNINVIGQAVKIRLLLFYGEWYFDNTIGIPYFDFILGHKSNMNLVLGVLQSDIEREIGIDRVEEINGTVTNREAKISFTAVTVNNEILEDTIAVGV